MTNMNKFSLILFLFTLLLQGCSDQSYVEEKTSTEKLSDDNVFKGYESALDKAKDVEQTIMDSAEQRKREIEEKGY